MKLVNMIKDDQYRKIDYALIRNGFKKEWNQYCPYSMFYTKNIDGNKTIYVRSDDIDKYGDINVYEYERWIRDNNKDVFDKTKDTDRKKYSKVSDIEKLLNFIEQCN